MRFGRFKSAVQANLPGRWRRVGVLHVGKRVGKAIRALGKASFSGNHHGVGARGRAARRADPRLQQSHAVCRLGILAHCASVVSV